MKMVRTKIWTTTPQQEYGLGNMEYQKNKYYEIAIVSDIGERKENEDAYGIDVSEENAAVVVCDGMGGFESGKLASGIAVNELIRLYRQRINQKKIEIARKYIEDGKMRVYEIADSIGWEDTAYFSRVFKKYTGYSPKEYEKLYRR